MNNKVEYAKAYRNTDVYSGTLYADPHTLITQMFDGVLTRIAQAREAIQQQDFASKAEVLSKAVLIIGALEGCLNFDQGGEIAANLSSLYEYMGLRLAEANLQNDIGKLDEVAGLLQEIRTAWVQIPSLVEKASA